MALYLPSDSTRNDAEGYWSNAFSERVRLYDNLVERHRGLSTPEDTGTLVENELRALQTQLALFHRCLNSLRPVFRLPSEILLLILHHLSLLEPTVPAKPEILDDRESRRQRAPAKSWIKVTHVCFAFRQIALGDRSLWQATTTAFGSQWMKLLVERARVPPRSVHIGVKAPLLVDMKGLLRSANTVQITELPLGESLMQSTIELPEARSLRVHGSHPSSRWQHFQPLNDMPRLTDLYVYGVNDFDLKEPCIINSLTSLYVGSYTSIPHKLEDILDMLVRLESLESFTLAGFYFPGVSMLSTKHIRLSALKQLNLSGDTSINDLAKLLEALVLSPGVRVHLEAKVDMHWGTIDPQTRNALERALTRYAWVDLRTLEVSLLPDAQSEMSRADHGRDKLACLVSAWRDDEPGYVCVDGQPTPDRQAKLRLGLTQDLRPEPDFRLQFHGHWDRHGPENDYMKAVGLFRNVAGLRTLSFRPECRAKTKQSWPEIFARHPHLTAIQTDVDCDFSNLLAALYFDQALPVRELKTLSFRPPRPWGYWGTDVCWTSPASEHIQKRDVRGALLASLIQQRMEAGAPLENIYLELSTDLWGALEKGRESQPDFMRRAREIIKPVEYWSWKDWGTDRRL
ncbi:hypothetical protein PENSPDRAFT_752620 [Peniophora sp. CONT]|nr:hypothetical protein PENSPDRAFT_752620 [Peniophora sp. CONT]